jgi:hypothetical protein
MSRIPALSPSVSELDSCWVTALTMPSMLRATRRARATKPLIRLRFAAVIQRFR